MRPEIAFMVAGVVLAFIIAVTASFITVTDSLTDDERNQLPRCDTVEEVLVGSGDFYLGQWDDYNCIDRDLLK